MIRKSNANDQARFILLDNSIVDRGGHFLSYATAVLDASRLRGYTPALVTHQSFRDVVPGTVQIDRLYRCDNWPLGARAPFVRWLRLNVLRQREPALPTAARAGAPRPAMQDGLRARYDALDLRVRSRAFERGTTAAFERLRPRSGDLIFLPNPWIPELHGLASSLGRHGGHAGASIHVLLRREFRQFESTALGEAIGRLRACVADGHLYFHTDTPELAQLYTDAFRLKFHALPLPHPITSLAVRSSGKVIQVCYSGDARCEKGFDLLPEIIRRVLEAFRGRRKICFVIQANAPSTGLERNARNALKSLKSFDPSAVSLILQSQGRAAYEATILSSDIMLLPYKASQYRFRSSGVLIEALSAGVPVLVPDGTWLANELRRFRQPAHASARLTAGLAGVCYPSEPDAAASLVFMLENLDDFKALARDNASLVRERHNAERLVCELAECSGALTPVSEEIARRTSL